MTELTTNAHLLMGRFGRRATKHPMLAAYELVLFSAAIVGIFLLSN